MKVWVSVLLIVAIAFTAASAQSQFVENTVKSPSPSKPEAVPEETGAMERVETRLVVSAVQVVDKKGVRVANLRPSDFEVREEGELQDIHSVTYGGSANMDRSIILVIDYSSSVVPYINKTLHGAEVLIDLLGPNDRMAIVTDDTEVLTDFTSDKELLKGKVESIRQRLSQGATGKSRQFCALMRILKELVPHSMQPPIVIFQTDGDQYAVLMNGARVVDRGEETARYSFADVLDLAQSTGTRIFTVSPGPFIKDLPKAELIEKALAETKAQREFVEATSDVRYASPSDKVSPQFVTKWYRTRTRDQKAIAEIAQKTGGWAEALSDAADIRDLYSRILRDGPDDSYLLTYYPRNERFDGTTRNVAVSLRGHPGYRVRGNKSYAAKERSGN